MSRPSDTPTAIERFEALLDLHGPKLERWPDADRRIGEQLAAHDAHAQRLLASALHVDSLLDELPKLTASAQLQRRVAELPARHPRGLAAPTLWPFATPLRVLLSAMLLVAVGLGVGFSTAGASARADAQVDTWGDYEDLMFAGNLDAEVMP